jgi:hypothetical protein
VHTFLATLLVTYAKRTLLVTIPTPSQIVLSTLEQAQGIMLQWFVPEGISAEQAMEKLLPILDNQTLMRAMRELRKELEAS